MNQVRILFRERNIRLISKEEGTTAVAPSSTERIDCSTNQVLCLGCGLLVLLVHHTVCQGSGKEE